MGLKACLFDMDGVIVDSAQHHFVAWQRLAEELSISFTEEDNHALKGLSRVDSLEHILKPLSRNMVDAANVWIPDIELSLAFNQPANFCHRNASIIPTTCYI